MLNQWNKHPHSPPNSSQSPLNPDAFSLNFDAARVSDPLNLASGVVSGIKDELKLYSRELPAPWFIYAFMGLGVVLCCITCIGHIAAEAINGCCLCFYTLLAAILILLEGALVAFIVIDRQWEKDLPFDPTGELDSLCNFIEANADVFKWVGIAVVIIQSLSILLALILRSLISTQTVDNDIEGDYDVRGRTWEPLLNSQLSQPSGSIKGDADIWSSRMREKYGLHGGDPKYNLLNQNASVDMKSKQ